MRWSRLAVDLTVVLRLDALRICRSLIIGDFFFIGI